MGFFFKNVLKHFVELAKKKNDKIYKYENRKDNVTHCQFKNRSSNLQFSTNKDCGRICDDNVYFLFTWPAYINQKLLLIDSLQNNIN